MELEAGNFDADDSDIKQRYDNQRQVPTMLKNALHFVADGGANKLVCLFQESFFEITYYLWAILGA